MTRHSLSMTRNSLSRHSLPARRVRPAARALAALFVCLAACVFAQSASAQTTASSDPSGVVITYSEPGTITATNNSGIYVTGSTDAVTLTKNVPDTTYLYSFVSADSGPHPAGAIDIPLTIDGVTQTLVEDYTAGNGLPGFDGGNTLTYAVGGGEDLTVTAAGFLTLFPGATFLLTPGSVGATPEPSAFLGLGLGLAGLGALVLKRRKQSRNAAAQGVLGA